MSSSKKNVRYQYANKNNVEYIGKLGCGSYGKVYKAKDENNNIVAIKRNLVSNVYHGTSCNIRELDILTLVKGHPFCIQLVKTYFGNPFPEEILSPNKNDTLNDKIFFSMEKGTYDTTKWLSSADIGEKKLYMLQILLAIEYLHSRGIYHRDLKPGNIIIFKDDKKYKSAKISDFGLADFYSMQPLSNNNVVTLWYRAPEALLCKNHDTKIDIWSLACIFFELFSKKAFYEPKDETELMTLIFKRFKMNINDFNIAKNIYFYNIRDKDIYKTYQSNIKPIDSYLNMSKENIELFNKYEMLNITNNSEIYSNYNNFINLLEKMFVTDPKKRFSASDCINHVFFKSYIKYIEQCRAMFDIDRNGIWNLKPIALFIYNDIKAREIAMKWFSIVYSKREIYPISLWYSHRILIHAIDLFDRSLILMNSNCDKEDKIVLWLTTCLFISAKYFRILLPDIGLENFMFFFDQSQFIQFKEVLNTFEERLIKDVFKCRIYYPTIYEIATESLNEYSIQKILNFIFKPIFPSNTELKKCWSHLYTEIKNTVCQEDSLFTLLSINN